MPHHRSTSSAPHAATAPLYLQKVIDNNNIESGLDRKNLTLLKKRFNQLNRTRLERIASALPERQQVFLQLLPLLFHVNHPMLPGYVSGSTPTGVASYTPSDDDIRCAKRLARSFKLNTDPNRNRQIHALFVMGSAGTIAHSEKSDLDIWLCHSPRLSKRGIQQLEQKSAKLTAWADDIGLEAHFFPMNADAFKRGDQANFDGEASGSAQHYLLLDEFYRSAVHIAGRIPLWWLVPSSCEANYNQYAETLLGKRFVRPAEVLDFGGVANIPKGEFAGAGIWQLYKGIDSPYKSVLKLLLLESYTCADLDALSLDFKAQIYAGHSCPDELDAYALIYRRIEAYLLKINDAQRLELARRCFYFKVNKPLSKPPRGRAKSWQRHLLENMVRDWQWTPDDLRHLDQRSHWKAPLVIQERRELVRELSASYRLLIEFVRRESSGSSINAKELQVLGRKLHAAFERTAGKLEFINPGISQHINEEHLYLCKNVAAKSVWQAYASPSHALNNNSQNHTIKRPLKQSHSLTELLLWCYGNGLFDDNTRLDIEAASPASPLPAKPILTMLKQCLPLPLTAPAHEAFLDASYCQSVALWVNSDGSDNHYAKGDSQGLVVISDKDDPLNFSSNGQSLIHSVDLITRSSWNEISSYHFESPESSDSPALIDALLQLLRLTLQGPPEINVYCFTAGYGQIISQRLNALLADIYRHLYRHNKASHWRYIFTLSNRHYLLQLKRGQPNVKVCANRTDLLRTLSWPQRYYSPIALDSGCFSGDPLHAIASSDSNASVQIYYRQLNRDGQAIADLYILDEQGSLFTSEVPFHNAQSLLRPLHRFLRRILERHPFTDPHNNPDFGVKPIDFYAIDKQLQLHRQQVSTDLNPLHLFDIEVIVERDGLGESSYSIFCEQQEFSTLVDGPRLFTRVAQYILQQRQRISQKAERYPCFITNLDISQCASQIAGDHGLQIIHYLRLKTELEAKLNTALKAL